MWTLDQIALDEMAEWDGKPAEERRAHLASGSWKTWVPIGSIEDWCEQHAIVARNALRTYLGIGEKLPAA